MATVLVVEERPVNRRFVVTLLQDRGHRGQDESLTRRRETRFKK